MNELKSLSEIYPYDTSTRTFTIPARLEQYADFFNPIDPSPAPTRDLAAELVDYLDQCSDEIPNTFPVAVALDIQSARPDKLREEECLRSLRSYYQHLTFVTQARIRRNRGQALKYLLVSIVCLAAYVATGQIDFSAFLWNVLREAILIGGWVFMWEAVTVNFIEMDIPMQEIKKYRRLVDAKITFLYAAETGQNSPGDEQQP